MIKRVLNQAGLPLLSGITVHCPGSPGHGSRFVENTAAEKLVLICTIKRLKTGLKESVSNNTYLFTFL